MGTLPAPLSPMPQSLMLNPLPLLLTPPMPRAPVSPLFTNPLPLSPSRFTTARPATSPDTPPRSTSPPPPISPSLFQPSSREPRPSTPPSSRPRLRSTTSRSPSLSTSHTMPPMTLLSLPRRSLRSQPQSTLMPHTMLLSQFPSKERPSSRRPLLPPS